MIPREDTDGHYERESSRRALFSDRIDAGRQLARALAHVREQRPLVLGIARGGMPVAAEVARALNAELDVVVARKLGAPWQPELALGAVTADGTLCINEALKAVTRVANAELAQIIDIQRAEAVRRERRFRHGRAVSQVEGRTVIVVDDGLATGATMRVVLRMLRKRSPERLIAAVPVGAPETCALIAQEADELVCPHQPDPLYSVGEHYEHFDQTSSEEVERLLREPKPRRGTQVAGVPSAHRT